MLCRLVSTRSRIWNFGLLLSTRGQQRDRTIHRRGMKAYMKGLVYLVCARKKHVPVLRKERWSQYTGREDDLKSYQQMPSQMVELHTSLAGGLKYAFTIEGYISQVSVFLLRPNCSHCLNPSLVLCILGVRKGQSYWKKKRILRSTEYIFKKVDLVDFHITVVSRDRCGVLGIWRDRIPDFDADCVCLERSCPISYCYRRFLSHRRTFSAAAFADVLSIHWM